MPKTAKDWLRHNGVFRRPSTKPEGIAATRSVACKTLLYREVNEDDQARILPPDCADSGQLPQHRRHERRRDRDRPGGLAGPAGAEGQEAVRRMGADGTPDDA